jgi:transcriptional regulator with XRE-family HTH domain
MPRDVPRERSIERAIQARLRRLERKIGEDLVRLRTDAAATKAQVARVAGVDRSFYGRIELGEAHASLETLIAIGVALGADPSVRFYAGTGQLLTDRHQAPMIECMLHELAPVWRPHLEVVTFRPARGFIDAVFERRDQPLLVIAEFESSLPRLEQQIRWAAEKASSIGSAEMVPPGPLPPTSRLLVLRSTGSTRSIARSFEATLRVAYPASTHAAVDALRTGSPWPGDAVVWIRIDGDQVVLLDDPPRGVNLGR